jgi:hypothetical protein
MKHFECLKDRGNLQLPKMMGIRISCKWKRDLYLLTKSNSDTNLKQYYKSYSKILTNVIRKAKRSSYNKQIMNSHNKIKTMWNIIKSETGRKMMKSDGFDTCKANLDLFNNYFLMIAEKITYNICNNTKIDTNNIKNPIHYLTQIFKNSFPKIKFNYTSAKETEKMINSLPSKNSHGYDEI